MKENPISCAGAEKLEAENVPDNTGPRPTRLQSLVHTSCLLAGNLGPNFCAFLRRTLKITGQFMLQHE